MKGCKTAPPKPARRGRETEKQPFYLSFVFSLPSTPPHPPPVSPSFLFSFHRREDFFLPLFLCLSVQLSHSNGKPGGFSLFFFFFLPSFLPSSSFLISLKGFCLLWEFRLKIKSRLFFLLFSLSLSSSEKGNKDELKRGRGGAAVPRMEMGARPGTKGARGLRAPRPRAKLGASPGRGVSGVGGAAAGCRPVAPPGPEVEGQVCS